MSLTRNLPAGWIAWDSHRGDTYEAGYHGVQKLYRTEATARMAIGKKRLAAGVIAVEVFAAVPLDAAPMVVPPRCKSCGHPADDHHYRHPFIATK